MTVRAIGSAPCAFAGCSRPARARNLCVGHYQQSRRGVPLKPLKDRKVDADGLRIVMRERESGVNVSVIAGEAEMEQCDVVDWSVTRKPTGDDGPKVARTVAYGTALRAYWYDSYLSYALPEEFALASRLLEDAILDRYDIQRPVYFEKATITQAMEREDDQRTA